MALTLEQSFPLGRYHATRWNQNPFEDRHGEWPPSPWRLLRALAARWFQYARETGDEDEDARNELLMMIAAHPPVFQLPVFTWRGDPAPRQYHKTEVAWTDASAKAAAYKKPKTTLVVDDFRAVSPNDRIIWIWENVELSTRLANLLRDLLKRILYFGRVETHCRFDIGAMPMQDLPRCELSKSSKTESPVLVAIPGDKLNLESLLASSDDKLFKGRRIPPGTEWHYARLPQCPTVMNLPRHKSKFPSDLQVIQFAVGGRVYPEQAQWVRVIEKFRGCVLKHAARALAGDKCSSYRHLAPRLRDKLQWLSGKDGNDEPVKNHQHAFFFLCPDESGNPTRLIVNRRIPFDTTADQSFEIEAILAASREPIFWQGRDPEWSLRLVPLPFEMPAPAGCSTGGTASAVWLSATPFAPPKRYRFRENGRLRAAESAAALLHKSLTQNLRDIGSTAIVSDIQPLDIRGIPLASGPDEDPRDFTWVTIHETLSERRDRLKARTRPVRPGFRFRVEFSEPIHGPLMVGHSSHFGLGLFLPCSDSE